MSQFQRSITQFSKYTDETDMLVTDVITPNATTGHPGFFVIRKNGVKQFINLTNNKNKTSYTFNNSTKINLHFVPLRGRGPWTVTIKWTEWHEKEGIRGEQRTTYIGEQQVSKVVTLNDIQELDVEFEPSSKCEYPERDRDVTVSISDANGPIPLASVLFESYVIQQGGYWESTPIQLSVLLNSIDQIEINAPDAGVLGRSVTVVTSLVREPELIMWGINVPANPVVPGDPPPPSDPPPPVRPNPGYDGDVPWLVQYKGTSGGRDVDAEWRNHPPSPQDILVNRIDGIRLRLETDANFPRNYSINRIRVFFTEEFATEPPPRVSRGSDNNLYIPRLQVLIEGNMDVSKYVSSFRGGTLELVVPDARIDAFLMRNPGVEITLDDNMAFNGRVTDIRKTTYATGIKYTLSCTSLFDMLGGVMDDDILTSDLDGNGKFEMPFNDDGGYITYITRNTPGVNRNPLVYENRGFRPISTWFQGDQDNTNKTLVRLDADYDWYQIYATQNQTTRGKLKDVAAANLYNFTSVAGVPALVPMMEQPTKSLWGLNLNVLFNTTLQHNRYLPEARLYTPEYHLNINEVPKAIEVEGLATIDGREDMLLRELQPIYWRHGDDGVQHVFRLESNRSRSTSAPFLFVNAEGQDAIIRKGSLKVMRSQIRNDFAIGNGVKNPTIEYIESGDPEFPDHGHEGIQGIIGVRMSLEGNTFTMGYYELELNGEYLYSASGARGGAPKSTADGQYLPKWAKEPKNFILEMGEYSHSLPKDKEVISNSFMPVYWLPKDDEQMNDWNVELKAAGRPAAYRYDSVKQGYYITANGYKVTDWSMNELADAYALERVLRVLSMELRYVGHLAVKPGDFIGIARRPEGGVHAIVEEVDVFIVLEDFTLDFTAGGNVTTSVQCGYVGTRKGSNLTPTSERSEYRDVYGIDWQRPKPPVDDALFF